MNPLLGDPRDSILDRILVYELVDTETGDRYVGQTRKDLRTTRRPQHFSEARSGRESTRPLHQHLRAVMEEGREDDIKIRPLGFDSEKEAVNAIGLDNLLNGRAGDSAKLRPSYLRPPEVLDAYEDVARGEITVDEAYEKLEAAGRRPDWNNVRDASAQLAARLQ